MSTTSDALTQAAIRYRRRRAALPYLLIAPTILVLALLVAYPIGYNLYVSLFDFNLIRDAAPSDWVGLGNYTSLAADPRFWNAIGITTQFTVLSVALEFILGFGLALLVNEALPARRLIRTILIIPILTTPLVVALVFRLMFHEEFGVLTWAVRTAGIDSFQWLSTPLGAFLAILVTEVWHHTSFVFLILLGALQMLPKQPYEAARLDGAGYWAQVWFITIPLLRPAILVALMFRLVFNIRLFEQVYVLTGGGPYRSTETISILIHDAAFGDFDIGYAASMSIVLTVLTVALAVGLARLINLGKK